MPALGTYPLGTQALGSTAVFDPPVVAVVAPTGTISTGGPVLPVQWTYSQAQGRAQAQFRVVITDDAGTVVHYDSGWIAGSVTTWNVNLVEHGVPTDSTDLAVKVGVRHTVNNAAAEAWSDPEEFDVEWGVVTLTLDAPSPGPWIQQSVKAEWTFSDSRSKTQGWYRCRLRGADSGNVYEDTGWVAGQDAEYTFAFPLSDLTRYRIEVTVRNEEGVPSTTESVEIFVQLEQASFPTLDTVGTIYEVAINGEGYMLYDDPDSDLRYRRRVISLDPARLATTETPFAEAVERYAFGVSAGWTGGRGQFAANRQESLGSAFWDSEGVNPFEPGRLTLLHDVVEELDTAYSGGLVVAGGALVVQTDDDELTLISTPGDTPSSFSISATKIHDLTSDGQEWYAACGDDGIFRGSTSNPGSAWSAVKATVVGWAGGRLCAAYASTGSSTPNVFTTISDTGTEETPGGLITLPAEWSITGFTSGSGFVFFGANSANRGFVYAWQIGSQDAPHVVLELPEPYRVASVFWYQGQVMIRASCLCATGGKVDAFIYRAVPDVNGALTPFLVTALEADDSEDYGPGDFAATESLVLFSWPYGGKGGLVSGLGAIDLASGGHARWLMAPAIGAVPKIVMWGTYPTFLVAGGGVYRMDPDAYVTEGWLRTSIFDGNSQLEKVWSEVVVQGDPLAAGESFSLDYTVNHGDTYLPTGAEAAAAGLKKATALLDIRAPSLGLQIVLGGDGSSTPAVTFASARYHALGLADEMVQIPIDCADVRTGLNGQKLPGGPGSGARLARVLQDLVQTRVLFQDVDWPETKMASWFEVVDVDITRVSVRDPHRGQVSQRMVALVTLRRNLK